MKNAEKGGYAVGAFNVYNLEGIEAVVAAAEAENSPAILQVSLFRRHSHPYDVMLRFVYAWFYVEYHHLFAFALTAAILDMFNNTTNNSYLKDNMFEVCFKHEVGILNMLYFRICIIVNTSALSMLIDLKFNSFYDGKWVLRVLNEIRKLISVGLV